MIQSINWMSIFTSLFKYLVTNTFTSVTFTASLIYSNSMNNPIHSQKHIMELILVFYVQKLSFLVKLLVYQSVRTANVYDIEKHT